MIMVGFGCFVFSTFSCSAFERSPIDVTLIGRVKVADGLGRIGLGIVEILHNDLKINHIPIPEFEPDNYMDISPELVSILSCPDKTPGNVGFLYWPLWMHGFDAARYMPQECSIKIAYSMIEGTRISSLWVSLLNEKFDAVVVPDKSLIDAYAESGVKIPIFELPHGVHLEKFHAEPEHKKSSETFVFGSSGTLHPRKNQLTLIEAFSREFGNNPSVKLRLHGRNSLKSYRKKIHKKIQKMNLTNVELIESALSADEYLSFMTSLDCYVLLSRGEGFSVTPRESLALGIPTIITNNTAHKTLCASGFVYAVPSEIRKQLFSSKLDNRDPIGVDFLCSVADAQKSLRDVYDNYEPHKDIALAGREWVRKYEWKNRRDDFYTLFNPRQVILGERNIFENGCLTTTSSDLYQKYRLLIEYHRPAGRQQRS
jgi:glycosyltransferase involved in cell wall biosynthesis